MKVYFDLSKQCITDINSENESIYTGDLVSELEVISNAVATTEYLLLSAKLPNGRSVGPILFDTNGRTDDATSTTWKFTLSAANGFTLIAGNTTFYIWLVDGTEKKCIGAVNININKAVQTGDASYFIIADGDDPDETLTSMQALINQYVAQVAANTSGISNLGNTKVDKKSPDESGEIKNTNNDLELSKTGTTYRSKVYLKDNKVVIDANNGNPSTKQGFLEIGTASVDLYVYDDSHSIEIMLANGRVSVKRDGNVIFKVQSDGAYFDNAKLLSEVATANIQDNAVVWEKLGTDVQTIIEQLEAQVLPDASVTTDKIVNGAVTTDKISDGAIVYDKLASAVQEILTGLRTDITNIQALIPAQASASNPLTDRNFVNSSIATNTATFRGTYNLVSDLGLTTSATTSQIATAIATKLASLSITADNNDYVFVQIPTADATPTVISRIDRYKYDGTSWAFEYSLNSSGFTAEQWAAINSGITSSKVSTYDGYASQIAGKVAKTGEDLSISKGTMNAGNGFTIIANEVGTTRFNVKTRDNSGNLGMIGIEQSSGMTIINQVYNEEYSTTTPYCFIYVKGGDSGKIEMYTRKKITTSNNEVVWSGNLLEITPDDIKFAGTSIFTRQNERSIGWTQLDNNVRSLLDAHLYLSTYSYSQNMVVFRNKYLYISIVDNNQGNDPATDDGTHWIPIFV